MLGCYCANLHRIKPSVLCQSASPACRSGKTKGIGRAVYLARFCSQAATGAMERLWAPVVDVWDDLRRNRARPADPSTPAPSADDGEQWTVVATADDDVLSVVERIEATGASEVILRIPREARAFRNPAAWPHIAAVAKRKESAGRDTLYHEP